MRFATRAFLISMFLTPLPSFASAPIHLAPVSGFVPNRGQAPAEVLYYAAVPGGALYLTRDALILDAWKSERMASGADQDAGEESIRRSGRALWVRFSGSSPSAILEGESGSKSRLHFFMGKESSQWRSDVPVYGRATYQNLWPGIGMTLVPDAQGMKCELQAIAGANLELARFTVDRGDGASPSTITVTELAELLSTGEGSEGRDDTNTLLWSTYLGGSAEELGWSSAIDSHGNVVVTGLNTSSFFPTTAGAYDEVYSGLGDVFVSKISADGSILLWSTFLGGSSDLLDYGYAVRLDPEDNPVLTGYTRSSDFPTTIDAYDGVYEDGEFGRTGADAFVTKLDAFGRQLIFSTYLGDVGHDIGYDLDLDAAGNVLVVGRTVSENFPTTPGSLDPNINGEEDGFITALSSNGEEIIWSTFFGGSLYDGVQSIRLDESASSLICGYTASTDFPGGSAEGLYDIFVAKVSSSGSVLEWSTLVGGSAHDYGTDLALDSRGNPVICGSTGSFDFPVTPGAYDESFNGEDDVVVAKLQHTDGELLWATFVGGTTPVYEIAHGIVIGPQDRPIVAGTTPSPDFPTTPDGYDTSHNGGGDAFLFRLNASGTEFEWGSFFGGAGEDYAYELARRTGDVVITGQADTGYPVTAGAYDESYNGDIADVFVTRVALTTTDHTPVNPNPGLTPPSALRISPNPVVSSTRIAFTLPAPAATKIELFDVQGRLRASIDGGRLEAGDHSLDWNALGNADRSLPSGVYAVRVTAGDWVQSSRVVLLR